MTSRQRHFYMYAMLLTAAIAQAWAFLKDGQPQQTWILALGLFFGAAIILPQRRLPKDLMSYRFVEIALFLAIVKRGPLSQAQIANVQTALTFDLHFIDSHPGQRFLFYDAVTGSYAVKHVTPGELRRVLAKKEII